LAEFEEALVFAHQRGLGETAAALEANCPALEAELGRVDEALERARRVANSAEIHGHTHVVLEVRSVQIALRLARGEDVATTEAEWLVASARELHAADSIVMGLAPAAAALARPAPALARTLLAELERTAGAHETPYYARQLPAMVRTALDTGDSTLAQTLVRAIVVRYPLEEHAAASAQALLAEHAGEVERAAVRYARAAAGWDAFGNVPERAYALLGEGRCLRTLGRAGAEQPLLEARELFGSMGFRPALGEVESLLGQHAVAP
jgi:hypothetical protein